MVRKLWAMVIHIVTKLEANGIDAKKDLKKNYFYRNKKFGLKPRTI